MRMPVNNPDLVIGPVLTTEDRVVLVAADHPLAGRTTVCIEDLGGFQQLTDDADILIFSEPSRVGTEPRVAPADRVQVVSRGKIARASSQDGEADTGRGPGG